MGRGGPRGKFGRSCPGFGFDGSAWRMARRGREGSALSRADTAKRPRSTAAKCLQDALCRRTLIRGRVGSFLFDPDEIARIFFGDNSLFNQKAPD